MTKNDLATWWVLTVLAAACADAPSPPGDETGGGGCAVACQGGGGAELGGAAAAGGAGGGDAPLTMVCANDDETAYVGPPGMCGNVPADAGCTCNIHGALIEVTCSHFTTGCVDVSCGTIVCGESTTCVDPQAGVCVAK